MTSVDVSNVLSYLNEETINYKSSLDITSVINLIDYITRNNLNTDSFNLYSIADKILSQETEKVNGSIVK